MWQLKTTIRPTEFDEKNWLNATGRLDLDGVRMPPGMQAREHKACAGREPSPREAKAHREVDLLMTHMPKRLGRQAGPAGDTLWYLGRK